LRRKYSNSLVIDAGSHFTLKACSQAMHREYNIGPDGKRSTVITTLPINLTQPLLGTITKYTDIESEIRLDSGKYREIKFEIGSNTGSSLMGAQLARSTPGDVLL
jgi:hypothetical protein